MEKFKDFLKAKGISDEDYAKKTVEEMSELQAEWQEKAYQALLEEVAKAPKATEVSELTNKINAFLAGSKEVTHATIKALNEALEKQGSEITVLKEGGKNPVVKDSIKHSIVKFFETNTEDLKRLKEQKGARVNFTVKVAGTMLTSTNLTPAGNRIARTETEAGRVGFVRRDPFLLDLVTVGRTNAKVVYWVEMVSEDGTVAMTAEGAVKSQIDWDYIERSQTVRKATAFTKVSKEMLDDVDNFAQDIENEFIERMALFVDNQILVGDGTGENLVGIDANATAFAAGALAATVDGANNVDALRAGVAQVYRSLFTPQYILLHPDDAAGMDLLKGTDGHYLLPPFVTAEGMKVAGVPIVQNVNIAAGNFYVGDFSKYKVKIREDIDIQIGYDSDDWTKNLVTPLAEMRLVGFIPANHYGAIVKGNFTTAKAALETP